MSSIEGLITQFGSPIAIAGYLLYERAIIRKEVREDKNRTIQMVVDAVNNNTIALTEIKTLIRERAKDEH